MRKKCQKSQKSENTISTLCWENKGAREKFLVHSGACFVKICFLFLVSKFVRKVRIPEFYAFWENKEAQEQIFGVLWSFFTKQAPEHAKNLFSIFFVFPTKRRNYVLIFSRCFLEKIMPF